MKEWGALMVATLIVATILGLLFQAVFWGQPVTLELAFLFVVVSLLLVTAVRRIQRNIAAKRRQVSSPPPKDNRDDAEHDSR